MMNWFAALQAFPERHSPQHSISNRLSFIHLFCFFRKHRAAVRGGGHPRTPLARQNHSYQHVELLRAPGSLRIQWPVSRVWMRARVCARACACVTMLIEGMAWWWWQWGGIHILHLPLLAYSLAAGTAWILYGTCIRATPRPPPPIRNGRRLRNGSRAPPHPGT
jgi:hypothetical protein